MADDRPPTGDEPEKKPAPDDAERERLERKYGWGPGDVKVTFRRPPKAPGQPTGQTEPDKPAE